MGGLCTPVILMLCSVMASPKAEMSSPLGLYDDDFDEDEDNEDEDEDEETRTLIKAAEESVQMGSIGPILKEELKAKIQLRRLEAGQEEIVPDFKQPTYEMTIEEIQKRNQKREKNRLSALRTRVRQKFHETELLQKIKSLEETHQLLTAEREKLQRKVLQKRQRLAKHLQDCQLACRDSHLRHLQLPCPSGMDSCSSGTAVAAEAALESDSNTSDGEVVTGSSAPDRLDVAMQVEREEHSDVSLMT